MMAINRVGTPVGPNGFVLCQRCGKEAQDVSKETSLAYAFHVSCRETKPPSFYQEDGMPSVPKPSEKKVRVKKEKAAKSPRVKKEKAARKPRMRKAGTKSHNIPKKGKCADWLAEIKEAGGIARQELIDGCEKHGLGPTMHNEMAFYCRQLNLLR
jgi:hypothetical protein